MLLINRRYAIDEDNDRIGAFARHLSIRGVNIRYRAHFFRY
jgi:hypothetical protein